MNELNAQAAEVKNSLVPSGSVRLYSQQWRKYLDWCSTKQIYLEDVLLVYFQELSQQYAPSSLWTFYSCINCYFQSNEGISLKKFSALNRFLKLLSSRPAPKQSAVFTEDQLRQYLHNAPNEGEHLVEKSSTIHWTLFPKKCIDLLAN
jgi:hypothetical protein